MITNTYHGRYGRILQAAAVACAAFAAVGVAYGLHEANPNGGWLVPLLGGAVTAIALGALWHVLIGSAAHVRSGVGVASVIVGGLLLALLALGVSAQAIATAMGGQSALSAELATKVEAYGHALDGAYAEATWFEPLAGRVLADAAGYQAMARREADGQLGSGSGCGPRCVEMESVAESFGAAEGALRSQLSRAEELRLVGHAALSDMRLAVAASDQEAFMLAAQGVAASVTALNAIDPSAIIASAGAVTVDSSNHVSLEEGTADLRAEAERLEEGRDAVAVPTFVPTSVGEATRAQMFKAAAHAWIAAGAIDVLPLLFLLLVLCTSREPLLRDVAPLRRKQSFEDQAGRIVSQEHQIAQGSKLHVVAGA